MRIITSPVVRGKDQLSQLVAGHYITITVATSSYDFPIFCHEN